MDKSKPWSRSIEDLHRGSNLPSPVGNSISRSGRHLTLRYGTLGICSVGQLPLLGYPSSSLFSQERSGT